MSEFWSLWIISLTVISIVLITWILLANRTKPSGGEDETTGHEYDGITELDNPLPAWWFYMFVITIVWGIGYLVFYPGMGNYAGLLNWTQVDQHEQRVSAAEAKYGSIRDQYLALPISEVAKDLKAIKMGMRMFQNNCAQCHGADARGSYGFPNLTDDAWQWGGTADAIRATLIGGRQAAMPAWGGAINDEGIAQVTDYVRSMSNLEHNALNLEPGKKIYQTYCVACHGADGSGNQLLGAPNLADDVWLYGSSVSRISHGLRAGRQGEMPAFGDTLSESKIHLLTAYVYSLRDR
ncbi:MAG: cytochrome-c oxidase, cbb3-type subunit III [Halioglobus sp.]